MNKIIPLQWLVDRATRELVYRAPEVNLKYFFDDGVETVGPALWRESTSRQTVMVQVLKAIEGDEVTLLSAFGSKIRNKPEPLTAIKVCGVSRTDAEKILEFCGIGPEALDEIPRATPEEIIERERRAGRTNKQIVAIIDAEWRGAARLTNKAMGNLFRNAQIESDETLEQRGKRLRGKKT